MNRYSLILFAALIAACGSSPQSTTQPEPAPADGEGVAWIPRTANDPPATVTSITIDADGHATIVQKPMDWQEENAASAAKYASQHGAPGVSEEPLLGGNGFPCGTQDLWGYDQTNGLGSRWCIRGTGVVHIGTQWLPNSLSQPLTDSWTRYTKSLWPGTDRGFLAKDAFMSSCSLRTLWSAQGPLFNYNVQADTQAQYLGVGANAIGCNSLAFCHDHNICTIGPVPMTADTIYMPSMCHSCVPLVFARDQYCKNVTWDEACIVEAYQEYDAGHCANPRLNPIGQPLSGCYVP